MTKMTKQEIMEEMTVKELLYYAAEYIREADSRIHEE